MPNTALYRAHPATLESVLNKFPGQPLEEVARQLHISVKVLRALRNGGRATEGVLIAMAIAANVPIGSLLLPDDNSLPPEPELVELLRHSYLYYVAHDSSADGSPVWFCQTLQLIHKNDRYLGSLLERRYFSHRSEAIALSSLYVGLSGHNIIPNEGRPYVVYQLSAQLLNSRCFQLTAIEKEDICRSDENPDAWTALFSSFIEGNLCGMWIGLDHLGRQTAYTAVISQNPDLDGKQLRELVRMFRPNAVRFAHDNLVKEVDVDFRAALPHLP